MRASLIIAASAISSISCPQSPAEAQTRIAQPRAVVAVSPRPTVFIGGYYYPTLYRASLWFDPWGPGYYGYPFYQYPIYGPGRYDMSAAVRVQVSPRQADVFVDGYFAGNVDDFDGVFQRLNIEPGEHEVEIYLDGHRPFRQRFYLQPGKSFNIRHTMEPLAPGEAASPRPQGAPPAVPAGDNGRGRGGQIAPDTRTPDDRVRADGADRVRPLGPGAPPTSGSLSLRVQPADADVLIDGQAWSGSIEGERLVVQLGTGTHHIEIRKEGYRSYFTDISIGTGQTKTLNVALTKQ